MEDGSSGGSMAEKKIIAKGAEADLFLDLDWNGKRVIIKARNKKSYRHIGLDKEIRRYRTIHEADIIHKAKEAGVPTPLLYQVNTLETTIVMEYVKGIKVRDLIDDLTTDEMKEIFETIGKQAGILHKKGIIHGDLTTSNMIKSGKKIIFIDFGLAEISVEREKRGVDLNLMNTMLESTHFKNKEILIASFRRGYLKAMGEEGKEALLRMMEIAKRGRYLGKE
jgi:TP53 regulating kinase-like protein